MAEDENLKRKLHPDHEIVYGEIIWAVRNEMARNIEDFLARRTRLLLLDAKASIDVARTVAELMAKELKRDQEWIETQVEYYIKLAKNYLLV